MPLQSGAIVLIGQNYGGSLSLSSLPFFPSVRKQNLRKQKSILRNSTGRTSSLRNQNDALPDAEFTNSLLDDKVVKGHIAYIATSYSLVVHWALYLKFFPCLIWNTCYTPPPPRAWAWLNVINISFDWQSRCELVTWFTDEALTE